MIISSYLKGKTVKNIVELSEDTDSNATLFCALKETEEDKSILKYKNQIRDFEQIECYIKQLITSDSNNE